MHEMVTLNIIIVNWNTADLLSGCLGSILGKLTLRDYAVTIVDNFSSDGSVAMLKSHFPSVKVIENASNLGFAKANNLAISGSDSEFVLLLNSDTLITEGSVERMIEEMRRNESIGILGPSLVYPDGSFQISFYSDPAPLREFLRVFFLEKLSILRKKTLLKKAGLIHTDWIMGSCMLVRRKVFEKIGLLDENVFMYYEDWDLCLRARNAGWRVACLPGAKIIHYENASGRKKFSSERELASARSLGYFYTKHYSRASLFLLKAARAIEAVTRIPLFAIINIFKRNRYYSYRIGSSWFILKGFVFKSSDRPLKT